MQQAPSGLNSSHQISKGRIILFALRGCVNDANYGITQSHQHVGLAREKPAHGPGWFLISRSVVQVSYVHF